MLRKKLIPLLIVGVLALPAVPAAASEAGPLVFAPKGKSTDRFAAVTTPQNLYVTAHDGVKLFARVYRPDTSSDPDWRTPVILVHSPYYSAVLQGSETRSMDIVQHFTPKGYTVALTDVRGTGNSGGCPEQDGQDQARDFRDLVEYFAGQPWSNGKVGSYGKSYDAETQNAGAVLRPEGLETMVTVAGISSLYDVANFDGVPLIGGGVGGAAAYTLIDVDPPGDPNAWPEALGRHECQPANFSNGADPTADENTYWGDRNFRHNVDKIEASVLYVHGLSDFTVSPIAIDGWYDEIPTFKRAIFGQWAHFYPYDSPARWARDDWYGTVHAWFDHELLGLGTGVKEWPNVQVQDEENVWRAVRSFAGMGEERALALGDAGALGTAGSQGSTATYREDGSAVWTSEPFADGLHLSGQAFLDAVISIDRPDAHLAVALQEVPTAGDPRTLTRGYLSIQHQEDPHRGHAVTPNYAVPYRVRTYPFDKTLSPGSRLRLVLGGFDPDTLPAGSAYTGTVKVDGASILRIPVVEEVCGIDVAQREEPSSVPGCVEIPKEQPRFEPDAARGHVATHRYVDTATGKIGDTDIVRETGYLTVRDGVELAFEVIRPAGEGKHPTLFTYDGYAAGASPDGGYAARYVPRGYALVGMSLRGTGCSAGVFDFFQPSEGPDGFEMVEWIARQSWSDGHVGMVGKSYPGITQLFVAETQPPHLDAVAPGHYYADAYRDVAFPGGIFNYAFAGLWSFVAQPAPGVQAQIQDSTGGDQTCAANLKKNLENVRTNPFIQAQEHPYDDALIRSRSPQYDFDQIEVPVYAALAWQDEQLASRQVHSLGLFEDLGIWYRAVLSNGDHGMYRRGAQLDELDRFFEAFVERRNVLRDGTARGAYLQEPPVTVFWEQGGNQPRWRTTLDRWSGSAQARPYYLGPDGTLTADAPTGTGGDTYVHSAAGSQGIGNAAYGSAGLPNNYLWDDMVPPEGAALDYTTAAFDEDTVLLGSASADLWISAPTPNVDLQVTLTEIRPDGQEVYIQQGWLRTKQRALDEHESTALKPVPTHQEADVAPLDPAAPSLARVEIFPFGHVVRKGSKLRLWIEAPTVLPQLWAFTLDPTPSRVSIQRSASHPSALVLPIARDQHIPDIAKDQPVCGAPLRQPCRPDPR